MHFFFFSSTIEAPDFCETDIIFKVYTVASQPLMETLTTGLVTSTLDDSDDDFIVNSQLNNILHEYSQKIGGNIPAFLLGWFFCMTVRVLRPFQSFF